MKNNKYLSDTDAEILRCENALNFCTKLLAKAPVGRLRVSVSNDKVEYYYCTDNNCGTYIKQKDWRLVRDLAIKACCEAAIPRIEKELKILYALRDCLENSYWCDFSDYLHPEKLNLAQLDIDDNSFFEKWANENFSQKSPPEIPSMTLDGNAFRSKSEGLIAQLLKSLGIPYRYEQELCLKDGVVFAPDFTIIDPYSHKEVYIEHFGMIDDPEYAINCIQRILEYEKNGIYLNINLFCTFETATFHYPFDCLEQFLKSIFSIK